MDKGIQDIINNVEKINIPKKIKNSNVDLEIKALCMRDREKNPSLSFHELSEKYGIPKELSKSYLNEFVKNSKKKPEKVEKKEKFLEKVKKKLKKPEDKKKILDIDDRKVIKDFLSRVILFGIPLNFALFVIFGMEFNVLTFIGWGIALWFIEVRFVSIIRGLWIK